MIFVVILLLAGASQISGHGQCQDRITMIETFVFYSSNWILHNLGDVRSDIKGRLLTPDEGCGLSPVPSNNRIIGGSNAKKVGFSDSINVLV